MAALGTSNRTAIRYVKEVTFGTTPATPTLKGIRYTGETLDYQVTSTVSSEVRPDRTTSDLIPTSATATGDINFELSAKSFDNFIESLMCSTWGTATAGVSSISNGVLQESFTLQKDYMDVSPEVFQTFNGCRVGKMSLDFKTGSIVTGSFTFMGLGATISNSQITGATTAESDGVNSQIMSAVTDFVELTEDGVTQAMVIRNLNLTIDNTLRAQDAIGSLAHIGIALGKLQITGTIESYFTDLTAYNKFINSTAFALEFKVQDDAGNYYKFTLPKVKFETSKIQSGGSDQDVITQGTIRALFDPTTSTMITIERKQV